MSKRENISKRQNKIVETLGENKALTTAQLAEMLGIGERTLRRDIKALLNSGYILRDGHAYRKNAPDMNNPKSIHQLRFNTEEIKIVQSALKLIQSKSYAVALFPIFEKFRMKPPKGFSTKIKTYETIREGINEDKTLHLNYKTADGKTSSRYIKPIRFCLEKETLYLLAISLKKINDNLDFDVKKHLRMYAFSRIVNVEKSDIEYKSISVNEQVIEDYLSKEHKAYANRNKRDIKLLVNYKLYEYLNLHPIHETQKLIKDDKNKTLRLTYISDISEPTIADILSLGANVEVTSPPELREAVITRINKIAEIYNQK